MDIKKDSPETKPLELREIGSTGLNRSYGEIHEEFLKELVGTRAIKVYKEMSNNDPTVGAMLHAISMLIRQVEWTEEPASDDPKDVEAAEFLKSVRTGMEMTWPETINEISSMLPNGFSLHEEVYTKREDGRIVWKKLPIRAQDTIMNWTFDDAGTLMSVTQQSPPDYRYRVLPMDKMLLFRTTSYKGNPMGKSILRNAYRPWHFKKNIENIEGIGIERDLAGLPIAKVPAEIAGATSGPALTTLNAIKKIVINIRRDEQEGVVFPLVYDESGNELYKLELLTSGGSRQFDTDKIVNRYDSRILMSMLADFILLGHEKVGSFSLSSSKTALFAASVGAWLTDIAEVFNRVAIPRLFKLNTFQVTKYPKLTHGDIETIDLAELGQYIVNLTSSGVQMFPDEQLENHLKRQAGLPTTQK